MELSRLDQQKINDNYEWTVQTWTVQQKEQQINKNYIRTVHHKFNTNQWLYIPPIRGGLQITYYQGALQWIIDNKMSSACMSIGYRRVGEDKKYLLTNYITIKITYNYSATGCGSTNSSNYIASKGTQLIRPTKKQTTITCCHLTWICD